MKRNMIIVLLALSITGFAQTKFERTIPAGKGQTLNMDFTWPRLIKIQTWDRQDILVRGTVSINRGEHDDAFDLEINNQDNVITVKSFLKDEDKITHRILIKKGDVEYYFKTGDRNDPEVQKFLEENEGAFTYMSNGVLKEIELEVFVPAGMTTDITSKFGLVEVTNFHAPLTATSKFGGIDATVSADQVGELSARTHFGEILSNLDITFNPAMDTDHDDDHWTVVSAKPGNGPRYSFESKFGKVYLRKPQ